MKVIGIALAAGAGSISAAAIMTNAGKGASALSVMIFLRRLGRCAPLELFRAMEAGSRQGLERAK